MKEKKEEVPVAATYDPVSTTREEEEEMKRDPSTES